MPFLLRYIKNLAGVLLLLIWFMFTIIVAGCFVVWEIPEFNLDHNAFPIFRFILLLIAAVVFFLTLDKKI